MIQQYLMAEGQMLINLLSHSSNAIQGTTALYSEYSRRLTIKRHRIPIPSPYARWMSWLCTQMTCLTAKVGCYKKRALFYSCVFLFSTSVKVFFYIYDLLAFWTVLNLVIVKFMFSFPHLFVNLLISVYYIS